MSRGLPLTHKMWRRTLLLVLLWSSTLTALGGTDGAEVVELLEDEGLQVMDVEREESSIPGLGGQDYPVYKFVPTTTFTCTGRLVPGYYADPEARCQVFHICGVGGAKHSFLCPEGSVFNQLYLVCDWWHQVACGEMPRTFYTHLDSDNNREDIQYIHNFQMEKDMDIFQRTETVSPNNNYLSVEMMSIN